MVGEHWIIDDGANRWLGRVHTVEFPNLIVLQDVCWVSYSGRLSTFIQEGEAANMEIEYLGDGSEVRLLMRAAIKWPHDLIRRTI